jgi:phosphoribosylglycinamide formyltransferase-1
MNNIAIFASGSGTNAEAIVEHFKKKHLSPVKLIISNNADAFVLERAKKYGIKTKVLTRKQLFEGDFVAQLLIQEEIAFIVLAGFMVLVPESVLNVYKNRIINIHPALLPKFGGKGMYGMHVHEAVIKSGEHESGITIHYVNSEYDKGEIILQAKCKVEPYDTPETLAQKIHTLEYEYYPKIIESIIFS